MNEQVLTQIISILISKEKAILKNVIDIVEHTNNRSMLQGRGNWLPFRVRTGKFMS